MSQHLCVTFQIRKLRQIYWVEWVVGEVGDGGDPPQKLLDVLVAAVGVGVPRMHGGGDEDLLGEPLTGAALDLNNVGVLIE